MPCLAKYGALVRKQDGGVSMDRRVGYIFWFYPIFESLTARPTSIFFRHLII